MVSRPITFAIAAVSAIHLPAGATTFQPVEERAAIEETIKALKSEEGLFLSELHGACG